MSAADAVTQDRVYRALKAEYLAFQYTLGERLDLQGIADRLRASKTPVREAVHRLVGEGLLEAYPGGGFRVWTPSRSRLIQIHAWNAHLLLGLVGLAKPLQLADRLSRFATATPADTARDIVQRVGAIFLTIADASGNVEAMSAVTHINERLLYTRIADISDVGNSAREARNLANTNVADVLSSVRRRLARYHERRLFRLRDVESD